MPKTTKEKLMDIISIEDLRKIKQAGVQFVDAEDYRNMEGQYNKAWSENKSLKLRIKQLEAQVKKEEAK